MQIENKPLIRMKNLSFIIALLSLITVSCDSDISSRLDDMNGNWQLMEMTYTDPQGAKWTISDSKTTLTFTKEIVGGDADGVRYGLQDVGDESFRYQYSVDFSQDNINILFEDADAREQLPLDAIGRNQVYKFEQAGKSRIVISAEVEVNRDRVDSEVLTNVRYTLEKQ